MPKYPESPYDRPTGGLFEIMFDRSPEAQAYQQKTIEERAKIKKANKTIDKMNSISKSESRKAAMRRFMLKTLGFTENE